MYDCSPEVLYERLSTRMLSPSLCVFWTTQSIAAITCETSTAPVLSATLTLTMPASGATPMKSPGRGSAGRRRGAAGDDAGHVGAVPVRVETGDLVDAALEREVGPDDDLVVDRSATGATPVSITATSMPAPVYPAAHKSSAPTWATTSAIVVGPVLASSSWSASTVESIVPPKMEDSTSASEVLVVLDASGGAGVTVVVGAGVTVVVGATVVVEDFLPPRLPVPASTCSVSSPGLDFFPLAEAAVGTAAPTATAATMVTAATIRFRECPRITTTSSR